MFEKSSLTMFTSYMISPIKYLDVTYFMKTNYAKAVNFLYEKCRM